MSIAGSTAAVLVLDEAVRSSAARSPVDWWRVNVHGRVVRRLRLFLVADLLIVVVGRGFSFPFPSL